MVSPTVAKPLIHIYYMSHSMEGQRQPFRRCDATQMDTGDELQPGDDPA
jgi:hypothetical protein